MKVALVEGLFTERTSIYFGGAFAADSMAADPDDGGLVGRSVVAEHAYRTLVLHLNLNCTPRLLYFTTIL